MEHWLVTVEIKKSIYKNNPGTQKPNNLNLTTKGLNGHTDFVRFLSVLQDGTLASCSHDRAIRFSIVTATSRLGFRYF